MQRYLVWLVLCLAFPAVSRAHFLWLLTESRAGTTKAYVFFAEEAAADDPVLLDRVTKAEAWIVGGRGEPKSLPLVKGDGALEAELTGPAREATLILRHTYGVSARGGSEPFLLNYYAKTYPFALSGTWKPVQDNARLPLEIVPRRDGASVNFLVTWQGKPLPQAVVTVVGPGITKKTEGPTDVAGVFRCELPRAGVYSIRAKHVEQTAGKHEDQEYQSVRHFSTLTLHNVPVQLSPVAHELPALPKGTTSFGGATLGDTVFVYGGNYGSAHEYANEDQSGDLWKLDLKKPGKWEQGPGGPKLQGLAMVAYKDALYRVGGFTATNKPGEKEDLRSQASFARLKADGSAWESLPDLPEPRSSHDAAVVGDTLLVVGGWNMQGSGATAKWQDATLAYPLAADKPAWKTAAAAPFKRRALALAAHGGKLYCLGGMVENGGPTTAVTIYNPADDQWSEGPALQGTAMDGFGASAFACQGALFVTTSSGSVQRLSADGKQWELVGQLADPRFFHRLLPWQDDKLIVVGGTNMTSGKTEKLELLQIGK